MPTMADITVKKADGTTNIVWSALVPSAGDSSAARWRSNTVSTIPGHRPTIEIKSRFNGTGDGRRVQLVGKAPITYTEAGVEKVSVVMPFDVSAMIPQMADQTQVTEAIHQFGNLLVSALIRAAFVDGYAPT